ncbi:MAG: cobyric acid synthase [Lachnospiraceae bacterium]
MAKVIMVQGTTSNAGKSLIVTALCRIFTQDGYKVAPFKSQNMALNSYITDEGLEMGRAQVVQAQAAKQQPNVAMNPILLKPTSHQASQVILNGKVIGNMQALDYFNRKKEYLPFILEAFRSLEEYDIVVVEGAGSPAEINLKKDDIVNMGLAKLINTPVLLVADIDRGGVFASLYGTYHLLEQDEQNLIQGMIINKFRGDLSLLDSGIEMMKELIPKPIIGVVPFLDVQIEEEDSLAEVLLEDRVSDLDIAVIRFPHISNFTDFHVFELVYGRKVRFITSLQNFGTPDFIILPGTKNTMADLEWLRTSGIEVLIKKQAEKQIPIWGICGGYQMLCETIEDPLNIEMSGTMSGMCLLKGNTIFEAEKTRTKVKGTFNSIEGIFNKLSGKSFEGYEVHMGKTTTCTEVGLSILNIYSNDEDKTQVQKADGSNKNNIYGTYVHGIFDFEGVGEIILKSLCEKKQIPFEVKDISSYEERKEEEFDKLADGVRASLDMDAIYRMMDEKSY